ncbi:MAG: hypothetical protein HKN23_06705 [Verrucomicrobiales bacterium]|nr:hypothetical protein [Verrucomicrobiales bacterium]
MKFYLGCVCLLVAASANLTAQGVPQTFAETWADYDPRAEPLEVEVIREVTDEKIVLRTVRYVVGTFEGRKTRVAAFYGFPENGKNLPAIVQVHGGGQFARKELVRFWASRGYAAIAVNWGEKVIDQADDPNTDWAGIPAGFLDPKHHNAVTPGEGTIHDVPHPWNSSWILYSAAARRAITFLEKQPEADDERVGLHGHSMGGRITMLTANDPRLKAVSPSVGGSGFLYTDIVGIPGSARRMTEDRNLYLATIDCAHAWPLTKCPVLFLGATNDFNSPMEFVTRGFSQLPDGTHAMSFTPHMNHRFTVDNYMARVRWFDAHLRGDFEFPKMPLGQLEIKTEDGIPRFHVRPDLSGPHKLKKVTVFYGYDRDPRARFWRSAEVTREGDIFRADCPVIEINEPLFVFANVTYDTGEPIPMPPGYSDSSLLTLTSNCRTVYPENLAAAGVKPVGERQRLIEDFENGWEDWSLVGTNHRAHWNYETHKVNDPAFVGPRGASLAFEIETEGPNETLAVVLDVDRWRGYTGRKPRQFVALVELEKAGSHAVELPIEKFKTAEGEVLENYDFVTSLILTPGQKLRPEAVKSEWQSAIPVFKNIRWVGGEFADRPRPYLKSGASVIDADVAFREAFDAAVVESVKREEQDRK